MVCKSWKKTTNLKDDLLRHPECFNAFQVMRLIEESCSGASFDEYISIKNTADFSFAHASITKILHKDNLWELESNLFSFLGGTGILPSYFTQNIADLPWKDRKAYKQFFDIFQSRLLYLAYKAWIKHKPYLLDHSTSQGLKGYLHAFGGVKADKIQNTPHNMHNIFSDLSNAFGKYIHSIYDLEKILSHLLNTHIQIRPFYGRRYVVDKPQQTRISSSKQSSFNCLGHNIMLGEAIFERQSNINIIIGPISQECAKEIFPEEILYNNIIQCIATCLEAPTDIFFTLLIKTGDNKNGQSACAYGSNILSKRTKTTRLGWTSSLRQNNMTNKVTHITFKQSFV